MLKDQPPCGIAKDTWIRRPELCQYLQFSPITLRRLLLQGTTCQKSGDERVGVAG